MIHEQKQTDWRKIVLFLITFCLVILCLLLAQPFLHAITWSVALAVATRTPYRWLVKRLKHPALAAAIGVLLVILLILLPVLFIVQSIGSQLIWAASVIQSGSVQEWISSLMEKHDWLGRIVDKVTNVVNFQQAAQTMAGFLADHLQSLLTGSVTTITQLVLMLFTLFFLFRDQEVAVRAFRSVLPLHSSQADKLMERMQNTISATVQGSLTIAAIQGCLGGLMFWILGVPNALIWTVVMAMLATIPSLGTFLVWMPVSVYLAVSGNWIKAAVLVSWGTFVIGTVDNLLYPTLVGSKLQLHTVPVLFSVLGGIGLFGISGIVLGPLVLTTAVTLLRFWNPAEVATESHSE